MAANVVAATLELDAELDARLRRLASERRVPAAGLMRDAVVDYVEREEWREQLNRDTMDAWEEYERTGLHLTHEEVEAWFEKVLAGEDAELPDCHV